MPSAIAPQSGISSAGRSAARWLLSLLAALAGSPETGRLGLPRVHQDDLDRIMRFIR